MSMGRLGKTFIRFPHQCEIYYYEGYTGYEGDDELATLKRVVWRGKCRKESNTSVRTFKGSDSVLKSDYRVQLGTDSCCCDAAPDGGMNGECGAIVGGIMAGMLIDITDGNGTFTGLTISDAYCGQLGTTVYCDDPKN